MTDWNTEELIAADKQFVWHPFTNMPEWCAPEHEPIVIVEGDGALLRDSRGREYIDGNSSIWTNIHGHNHPRINRAIREQLERIAHSSFLGTTNPVAIELAREIVELFPPNTLSRVFYSDDGSTGIEAALRIAAQFFQMRGEKRNLFVAFRSGYHGDTAGAAALGAAKMFSVDHEGWRFPVRRVGSIEELEKLSGAQGVGIAAVVVEPIIQGAAGMRIWPHGTSAAVRDWCNQNGALMIADSARAPVKCTTVGVPKALSAPTCDRRARYPVSLSRSGPAVPVLTVTKLTWLAVGSTSCEPSSDTLE